MKIGIEYSGNHGDNEYASEKDNVIKKNDKISFFKT